MKNRVKKFKKPLFFVLYLLPVALIGGWFMAQYYLTIIDASLLEDAIRLVGSTEVLQAIIVIQTALYAIIFGFFGYILGDKIGLMRSFRFHKTETVRVVWISVLVSAIVSLDAWTFAKWIPELNETYAAAGSLDAPTWIASVLYGGVIEEIMLRLFLMSLFAFLGWKVLHRKENAVPRKILIAANILAAFLFAAGHLPTTAQTLGGLTPLLVLRCFLLNGAIGLLFGRFYRKYGIQYAMLSHALFHLVTRTIWLIVIP